ncbi:hypothetical protein MRX96_037158 [Rhipicephalus microplus]
MLHLDYRRRLLLLKKKVILIKAAKRTKTQVVSEAFMDKASLRERVFSRRFLEKDLERKKAGRKPISSAERLAMTLK